MLLYIHIPFCQSKCPYCAFGSVVGQDDLAQSYFKALCKDLKHQISLFKKVKFSSVFIGGGTPSVMSYEFYSELFSIFLPYCVKNVEITSEANPNSATLSWLKGMKSLGCNRISFGVQSFFEDKLKFLGRNHNKNDAITAVKNAKLAGFKNINIDLIYATKLDNKKRLKTEIDELKKLKTTHVSAYALSLEENTPFEQKFKYKKDSSNLANFVIKELEKAGFKQYEISNFGKICKHNLGYWKGDEYIGVGAYSVGFYDKKRVYATKNLKKYIAQPNFREFEILSSDDLHLEHVFLGARSIIGIDKNTLNQNELKNAMTLKKSRKLNEKDSKFYIKNFLLADEIALFITQS